MQIITTHNRTDFDALASVVAASFLYPGAVGVLPRIVQPRVRQFLTVHRDLFRLRTLDEIDTSQVTRLIVVDTNHWKRLDQMEALERRADLEVHLWDHHMSGGNIQAAWRCQEEVGATITLMAREIERRDCAFAPMQATLFLLGLYDDTGTLSYPSVKPDDARAAAFLLENGADLHVTAAFLTVSFDEQQKEVLTQVLASPRFVDVGGHRVGIAALPVDGSLTGLSEVVDKFREILGVDAAFGVFATDEEKCIVIGRAGFASIDVGDVMRSLGGNGHSGAGSAMLKTMGMEKATEQIVSLVSGQRQIQIPVKNIMSDPGPRLEPTSPMEDAIRLLAESARRALIVVDGGKVVGLVSRVECAKAKTPVQRRSPVKGFMRTRIHTLTPDQGLKEAARLMANEEAGVIPVLEGDTVVGVVTAADLVLELYTR